MIVKRLRTPRTRMYLLCSPEHFAVDYAINPWMEAGTPVDTELAVKQCQRLRETLESLGHVVHLLLPRGGMPDMVFAANGAFSVDGMVYGARFKYPQRSAEEAIHRDFYESQGWSYVPATEVNEGEGDFGYVPEAHGGLVLAGYGFRTELAAHAQAQEVLRRPVVSLKLVDPRFYHLDIALAVLDDRNVSYFPGAFAPGSQDVLAQLFPDALLADRTDAESFGLNLVSDGRNVLLPAEAVGMSRKLAAAGYTPVPIELSELRKGGGSVKCCVAELRP